MLVKGTEISGNSGATKKKKVATPVPNILANPSLANAPVAPTPVPVPAPTPVAAPNILSNPSLANAPIVAHDSGAGVLPPTTPNILANPSLANAPANTPVASPALPNAPDLRYDTPWAKQIATDAISRQEAARLLPNGFLATGVNPYGSTDGTAGGTGGSGSSGGGGGGTGGSSDGSYGADGLASSIILPTVPDSGTDTNTGTSLNPNAMSVSGSKDVVKTPEIPVPENNKYFDDVVNSKFDYNPATDQGYQMAAAQAENSIIQSIIGRGGLYSSVAQNAIAAKMSDLAITYQETAYKKYTDERAYKMQLAQFEQDRINTSWEQNFKNTQFEAGQSQQEYENQASAAQQKFDNETKLAQAKFENELNLAQFQFTQEKEAFDERMTAAAAQQSAQDSYSSSASSSAKAATASQEADLNTRLLANQTSRTQLANITNDWQKNGGVATKAVADFFSAYGVQVGSQMSDFQDIISGIRTNLDKEIYDINAGLTDVADQKRMSQFMDDYMNTNKNNAPAVAEKAGTTADNATPAQSTFYYQTLNQVTGKGETAASTAKLIKDLSGPFRSSYEGKMGSYYFGQLLSALQAQKVRLQNSSSSNNIPLTTK